MCSRRCAQENTMRYVSVLAIALAVVITLSAPALAFARGPTIVDTALAVNGETGEFSILIAALEAEEELIERLSARGQYTVFAPTDAAFTALFVELAGDGATEEQINKVAQDILDNPALLSAVLSYHVAPGVRQANAVTRANRINTLSGEFLRVSGAELTDAQGREAEIVNVDIRTSNGVIHVIDRVVLPMI